jgi:hypothetical protein
MYYKAVIDKTNYSYQVSGFTGTVGNRAGTRCNPIVFYEKGGTSPVSPTPTPTVTHTPSPTVTPTPSVTPTITMSPSTGSGGGTGNFVFVDFYFSLSYNNVGSMDIYRNGTYIRRLSFDGESTQVKMVVGDEFYCQLTHSARNNIDDRGTISSLVDGYVVDYVSTPGGSLPRYATSDIITIVDGNTYSVYGACGGTENLMPL